MKTKEQALSKGDWIVVKLGSYYHHGLYISDDEVIHYCSSEGFSILRKDMTVQSTDLHTFSLGKKVLTKIVEESPVNSVDVRVDKALSQIGAGNYDFFYNNCEHFVHYCFYNERKSQYIDSLIIKELKKRKTTGINGMLDLMYLNIIKFKKEG